MNSMAKKQFYKNEKRNNNILKSQTDKIYKGLEKIFNYLFLISSLFFIFFVAVVVEIVF